MSSEERRMQTLLGNLLTQPSRSEELLSDALRTERRLTYDKVWKRLDVRQKELSKLTSIGSQLQAIEARICRRLVRKLASEEK